MFGMSHVLFLVLCLTACGALEPSKRSQIPLALALKFNSITSASELMHELSTEVQNNATMARMLSSEIVERKAIVIPEPAGCMPEKRTVRLKKSDDLSEMYFPSCTRIERCGGCCSQDDLLSCQPTEIEIINFQVHVMQYIGGTKLTYKGKEIISMEKHIKCKCGCITKASDCNGLQVYVKENCQCVCTNKDEQAKCLDSNIKFWDSENCTCQCLKIRECSTGFTFNKHTCSCESEQRPRIRFGDTYSTNLRITPNKRDEYSIVQERRRNPGTQ